MAETDLSIEILYPDTPGASGGAWHEISTDAYARDPISISRGRDEAQQVASSTMNLTLDNRDGTYSPRNPSSSLYGLIGRNTPIRVAVRLVKDTFTRTTSSGWGTADSGHVWAGANAALSTTGTKARWTHTGTSNYFNVLNGSNGQVDVVAQCNMRIGTKLTGSGAVYPQMLLRFQDSANFYTAGLYYQASGTATGPVGLVLARVVGGSQTNLYANFSWDVYNGSETFNVKAEVVGTTIRIKAWRTTVSEPAAWNFETTDTNFSSGQFAMLSRKDSGVTSVDPTIDLDDLDIRAWRFHGEVEAWPVRWDVSDNDAWSPIVANGILRRFTAPGVTQVVGSALYFALLATSPLAYWPMEEGDDATTIASALSGGSPATSIVSPAAGGAGLIAAGSAGGWTFADGGSIRVPTGQSAGAAPNGWEFEFTGGWETMPTVAEAALVAVAHGVSSGDGALHGVGLTTSSGVLYWARYQFDASGGGGTFAALTELASPVAGRTYHVRVRGLEVAGPIKRVGISVDGVDATPGGFSGSLQMPTEIAVNAAVGVNVPANIASFSHLAFYAPLRSSPTTYQAAAGYVGETAADRITRLCDEAGITLSVRGDSTTSELMGAQRPATRLDSMLDAQDVDGGILYEPKGYLGLRYRTGGSRYNQTAGVSASYSAGGEVAPPLEPVEDSDVTANDVTVTRVNGGKFRVIQATGTLNVQEPPVGVGRYQKDVSLVLYTDSQCMQQAAWIKHIGTVDEARYPVINLDPTAMSVAGKLNSINAAAGLDVGDRISITGLPSWLPPDSIEAHAEGFREVLGTHHWTIAVNATPATPYDVLELETSTSDNLSRIPAGATTLNEALDTTETGVDIISVTTRFIDSATYSAQFPFDVLIGGERMRVTACSGTGLTQTFTVTRSINGVVKSHASGTAVQLFRPPVIAR